MDLTGVFALAEATLRQALATSGTTVDLARGGDVVGGSIDPATLAPVTTEPVVYAAGVPAIAAASAVGAMNRTDQLPAVPTSAGAWTFVLPPDAEPAERDVVRIATCRDEQLVGRRFVASQVTRSSAGAAVLLAAAPVRQA